MRRLIIGSRFIVLFAVAAAGIFFAPILHRFLHHFHLEMAEADAANDGT